MTAPRPQDDLFRHVNGDWLDSTGFPPDRSSAGSFVDLDEQATLDVRAIIEGLSPEDEGERGKIATLWTTFMDAEQLEQLGAAPLLPFLARVDEIASTRDLARHWGWCLRHQTSSALGLYADADMDDPTVHAPVLVQSGLGLPDRDYYLDDQHAGLRQEYRAHVQRSLELARATDAAAQAELVVDLETEIARCHWTKVQVRDMQARHNPMPWPEFAELVPGLHPDELLAGAGITADDLPRLNVSMPSFFTGLQELVTSDRLDAWRAWARWSLVRDMSPYLSTAFVEERFDFYGRTLQGTPEMQPRWKRGVQTVEGVLGEAVAQLYVERHFPAGSKTVADEMVTNLLEAYRQSIQQLDWMGDQTRAEALHKLDGFNPKIGYPPRWRDLSALEVVPGDLVASLLNAGRHEFEYMLGKLREPVDRDEWLMLPQTVNAYYHPLRNEIVFPAAILQPPFFDAAASLPANYGGIGAVIGHEIGHGFDDQGSTCDGDGRLRNWWTEADHEAFAQRTAALVAQFDALTPAALMDDDPRPHVNGSLTIGENIGDLGGVSIALKALALALGHQPTPDEAREFFVSYARIWRTKNRDERARQLLVIDPHSPAEFRCNQIVANLDTFHETFGTTPADGMWLDESERVAIW